MGVVGHQPGIVALRKRRERVQRRDVAIHGKDAVGHDQCPRMAAAMFRQKGFDMVHVAVPVGHDSRARETRAGPQAGMRQFVDQDEVLAADQRRDDAEIGEIARAEDAGRLGAFPMGQPRFEFAIKRMIAGDQPRGAGADAVDADRLDRRLLDGRMMRQVEIVVAAERQQPAAVAQHPDSGHAGGIDEDAPQRPAVELAELERREFVE